MIASADDDFGSVMVVVRYSAIPTKAVPVHFPANFSGAGAMGRVLGMDRALIERLFGALMCWWSTALARNQSLSGHESRTMMMGEGGWKSDERREMS